ncbi:MAG: YfhO family protein [Candidatus Buchananbacteria bacterium]
MKIELLRRFWPVFAIFLLVFLFFLPNLVNQSFFYAGDFSGSDLTELNLPLRYLSAQSLAQAKFPLWTQLLSDGFPLLAEGQAGVFYPLNLIFVFLPFGPAVNFDLFINFFLAAIFTYAYCRILKISRAGSFLAALAFAFSGFFIFRIKHLNLINAAIWLPLQFYLIEKYFAAKNKNNWLVGLGLVFVIQFFAGHPQISYICILSCFIYFLLKIIFLTGKFKLINFLDIIKKILLPWAVLGVIVFGLGAIQFLPTWELSRLSDRSQWLGYEASTINLFPPKYLATVINPYLFANPAKGMVEQQYSFCIFWENSFYAGCLTLILAVAAVIFLRKNKLEIKIFLILLLFSLFFILGKYNWFYAWAWILLPGLKVFRFPQRFLLLAILVLTCLGGLGFDYILSRLKILKEKFKYLNRSKSLFWGVPAIMILVLILELYLTAVNYLGAMPYQYFSPGSTVKYLQQDKSIFRYQSIQWSGSWSEANLLSGGWLDRLTLINEHKELIQPNLNVFYNLSQADDRAWQEGGQLESHLASLWRRGNQEITVQNDGHYLKVTDNYLKMAGMQNIKYLLSFYELKNDNLNLVKEVKQTFLPGLKIYQNGFVQPRAYVVFKAKVEKKINLANERLVRGLIDFDQEILLDDGKDLLPSEHEVVSSQTQIKNLSSDEIEIKTQLSQPGYLFLSQTLYPGWQAEVDGRPSEIIRANSAFSVVALTAGSHEVIFKFRPKSFFWGAIISLVTLIVLLGYFVVALIYWFKAKRSSS